jgi:SAM-dependent methyltransferase
MPPRTQYERNAGAARERGAADEQSNPRGRLPAGQRLGDAVRRMLLRFVLCRAAFKNFSQPLAAMNEMHRVLKPGGRALIIDLRSDTSLDEIDVYIKRSGLSWANSLIYKATFRYLLLPRAYSRQEFLGLASRSAFAGASIEADEIGYEVTLEKRATTP